MSKYSAPPVTLRDVLAALPMVVKPLAWRVAVYPSTRGDDWAMVAVELVLNHPNASTSVWKRWGRQTSTRNLLTLFQPALLAAHEAHAYCEGKNPEELAKLVTWEAGARGTLGGGGQ